MYSGAPGEAPPASQPYKGLGDHPIVLHHTTDIDISKMHALFFLPLAALFALASASALPHAVSRRDSRASSYPVTVSRSNASKGFGFSHERNEIYTATIAVNGVEYQVLLDGGSSDTWLDPSTLRGATPPGLIETGANISTTYVYVRRVLPFSAVLDLMAFRNC